MTLSPIVKHVVIVLIFSLLSKACKHEMALLGLLVLQGHLIIETRFGRLLQVPNQDNDETKTSLNRCLFTWHLLVCTLLLCFPPQFQSWLFFPMAALLVKVFGLYTHHDALRHVYHGLN